MPAWPSYIEMPQRGTFTESVWRYPFHMNTYFNSSTASPVREKGDFGHNAFFSPMKLAMLPRRVSGFGLNTQLSECMAKAVSPDKDNTTRKCTLKVGVDTFHWRRTQLEVCLCCKFES